MKTKSSKSNSSNIIPDNLIIYFCLLLWPLSIIANSPDNFTRFLTPGLLVFISYLFYCKKSFLWPLPILFLPLIDSKLLILPPVLLFIYLLYSRKQIKQLLLYFLISFSTLIIFLPNFQKHSIFYFDYEANQALIRKIYLYPNIYLARINQNKPSIYFNKATDNFYAIIDPNNYFFAFHPREISLTNQNLNKFPFPSLIFFLIGLFYLLKKPQSIYIIILTLASIINLSLLKNIDLTDFILFIPISLIIIYGAKVTKQYKPTLFKLCISFSIIIAIFKLSRLLFVY